MLISIIMVLDLRFRDHVSLIRIRKISIQDTRYFELVADYLGIKLKHSQKRGPQKSGMMVAKNCFASSETLSVFGGLIELCPV